MLAMKTRCKSCQAGLEATGEAYICSYECTYCAAGAESHTGLCPACRGELLRRPTRVKAPVEVAADTVGATFRRLHRRGS